ncbi:MAG: hypothetical protein ACI9QD_000932, partial [Thermoproteota archaeon]
VVEFLKGKAIIHDKLEYNILTNHDYVTSVDAVFKPSSVRDSQVAASLMRFRILTKKTALKLDIKDLYNKLNFVKIVGYTQWQIIYDLTQEQVHFRTNYNKISSTVKINDYDLNCTEEVMSLSLKNKESKLTIETDLLDKISKRLLNNSNISDEIKQKLLKRSVKNNCFNIN